MRGLATAFVLLVSAIAAVVSYIHVESLAATHGQDLLAAVLLPVSVDGTVAAASLQMLDGARQGLAAHPLQRTMLFAGVAATLAANVIYGLPGGPVSAVISGWPAAAFIGSVEMTMLSIRRGRAARPAPAAGRAASVTAAAGQKERTRTAPGAARRGRAAGGHGGRSAQDIGQAAAAMIADTPGISRAEVVKELAARTGVSVRTVRRHVPADMAAASG